MEEQEMQIKVKKVTDKFTESMYVLANEPSVALYRLQEHVRRSLPELAQHKADMQNWEEQSQGSVYTVEYACSAVRSMTFSSVHFKSIDGLLKQSINLKHQMNAVQSRSFARLFTLKITQRISTCVEKKKKKSCILDQRGRQV
ncbi:BLOC-1-related complex subunit 8 isoform X1 [Phyllobates terribilis]|uniref:BLOC-1-related complex subunit 8 isoform X1 n=1 Tax=Phyllobates terribilis TaxID=111132 RepID=UPI003CCB5C86